MAKYQITTNEGPRVVTGAPVGHYLAVRAIAEPRTSVRVGTGYKGARWVVDHRPTGLRLAAAHTRADARRIARIVSDAVGDGLDCREPSYVVRAIVRSVAWADLVAHREGITRADALRHASYVDMAKVHRDPPLAPGLAMATQAAS